jgi:hypothetical protein
MPHRDVSHNASREAIGPAGWCKDVVGVVGIKKEKRKNNLKNADRWAFSGIFYTIFICGICSAEHTTP